MDERRYYRHRFATSLRVRKTRFRGIHHLDEWNRAQRIVERWVQRWAERHKAVMGHVWLTLEDQPTGRIINAWANGYPDVHPDDVAVLRAQVDHSDRESIIVPVLTPVTLR